MLNTVLTNNSTNRPSPRSVATPSSSSRVTRAQFEHQNKLRALYHDAELSNSDPDPASEGEENNYAKENINIDSMTPVPLKEEEDGPETEGGSEKNNDALKSAVTPSPKQDKDAESSPVPLTKEEIKARAERRANYPLTGIAEPGENDCLFGRGGGTNHHPGNKRYRKLVEDNKGKYLASKRLDKPLVAMEIINGWRGLEPPGRFLKQDDATKFWVDVGDKKAREKTSQALREKTPVKQREPGERTARFEPGCTSPVGRDVRKSSLARDHSLGTEMGANDISLEGFSWEDSDKPVVRNENASVSPTVHPRHPGGHPHHYPPHYGEHYQQYPPRHEYHRGEHPHPEHGPPPYPYVREHSLSNNPLSDATTSHPAPPTFGETPSHYSHHYPPGYGHPPPPPPPGHHGPYHPPPPYSSHSPTQTHHYYEYPHQRAQAPPKQRSREHSLQMNPLKGASTAQPAHDTFNEEESHASYDYDRPPPLPSPTYDGRGPPPPPPPYYGYGAPSPTQSAWPTPPGHHHPSPQFSYHTGSNPSAFGRYSSGDRSNSLRSLGSSVDAYYDRRDSSVSGNSGSQSRASAASATGASATAKAPAPAPSENPASAGTPQDYSKIAELIRDSSDKSSSTAVERSASWDEKGVKGNGYEDSILRSRSMPSDESGGAMKESDSNPATAPTNVDKPSLIRKLSGGGMARNASATPLAGILRPNPVTAPNVHRPEYVKRDTSNQPETLETKRSIKRVVLSRDQSAVSRRLKEQQGLAVNRPSMGGRVSSRMTKSEMIDRNMSVELNKLGLEDRMNVASGLPELDRMTTEDVLTSLIDDDELLSPRQPEPLGQTDCMTTIDAIALDIANGKPESEWDDTLDMIEEPAGEIPGVPSNGSGVNADIAEKWLKGET